ncbi:MAG: NosD domain-containing protein [Candidatus Altiarchaeota archaeon]
MWLRMKRLSILLVTGFLLFNVSPILGYAKSVLVTKTEFEILQTTTSIFTTTLYPGTTTLPTTTTTLYPATTTLYPYPQNKTVCNSGCDYLTIQAAVDNVDPSDNIYVHNGTYEGVTITKSVNLQGQDREGTIIYNGTFDIDSATNITVKVSNFTIRGSRRAIRIEGGDPEYTKFVISDNKIVNNTYGIIVHNPPSCVYSPGCFSAFNQIEIINNIIQQNDRGILLSQQPNTNISNNIFTDNNYAILMRNNEEISFSSYGTPHIYNRVFDNLFNNNSYGVYLDGTIFGCFSHNITFNNFSDTSNYDVALISCQDSIITNNFACDIFDNSINTIENNICIKNRVHQLQIGWNLISIPLTI